MYKTLSSCHAATQNRQLRKTQHHVQKAYASDTPKPLTPALGNTPTAAAKPRYAECRTRKRSKGHEAAKAP